MATDNREEESKDCSHLEELSQEEQDLTGKGACVLCLSQLFVFVSGRMLAYSGGFSQSRLVIFHSLTFASEGGISLCLCQNTKWKNHFSISQTSREMDTFKGRSCLGGNRQQRTTEGSSSSQAEWSMVSVRWPLLWDVRGSQVMMETLAHLPSPGSFLPSDSERAC